MVSKSNHLYELKIMQLLIHHPEQLQPTLKKIVLQLKAIRARTIINMKKKNAFHIMKTIIIKLV